MNQLPSGTSRRSRRLLEAGLAAVVLLVAAILVTAPLRRERSLRQASLADLQARSQHDPNDPRLFFYLGERLRQHGLYQDASNAYERAVALGEDDEETWLGWATAAGSNGDVGGAAAVLHLDLRRHPRSAAAHLALAVLYAQTGSHLLAAAEAGQAAILAPKQAETWRLAGLEALKTNDFPHAEDALRHAVQLTPQDWRNQVGLGNVLLEQGQGPESLACFQKAAQLAPQESVAQLALGRALLRGARSPADRVAAIMALRDALTVDPANSMAERLLGESLAADARWPEARTALEHAAALSPDDLTVYYLLARVDRSLGDIGAARHAETQHQALLAYNRQWTALGDRIKIGGKPADYLALARLLAEHRDYARAAATYRSLLSHPAHHETARKELAVLEQNHPSESRTSVNLSQGPGDDGATAN